MPPDFFGAVESELLVCFIFQSADTNDKSSRSPRCKPESPGWESNPERAAFYLLSCRATLSNPAGPAHISPTSSVLSGRAGIYQDTYLNKGLCGVGSHRRAPLTFPGQFLCEACKRRRVTLGTSRAWYTKAGLRGARLYQGRKG